MSPISAIIFDMGDIFYDATLWRRTIVAAMGEQGHAIEFAEFVNLWEAKLASVYVGQRPYWDSFDELLSDFGLDESKRHSLATLGREKARQVENRVLFSGVAQTLAQLRRRGIKLAVLSDTESHEAVVRSRLAALGIESPFSAVVTSIDIGHVKPEPAAYQAALDRLGVLPAAAAFVGHDDDELEGAMSAGLMAIGYNCREGAPCHRRIEHFSELPACVAGG